MKSIKAIVATLIVAALAACGGQAQAAPLQFNFKASDGTNFSIDHAVAVEKTTNGIAVTLKAVNADGQTVFVSKGFADAGGVVWTNKVLPAITSTGLFIREGATNRYIGAQAPRETQCNSPYSTFFYTGGTIEANFSVNDSCAIHSAINALSN